MQAVAPAQQPQAREPSGAGCLLRVQRRRRLPMALQQPWWRLARGRHAPVPAVASVLATRLTPGLAGRPWLRW